ncbi:hypothetical protein VitviT2T_004683 [Vitis vinifera]|uniref:BURP domain-containing protein n=2 Tax=Vitis vinifera TaxID=29760 RepID=A0ABY9BS99_VITVI|nr:hypothetical protein VitviT2T_004683 [Vitis vinifera]
MLILYLPSLWKPQKTRRCYPGSYDAIYGNPNKQGDAAPVTGSYDAVYGNPKKQGDAAPVTGSYDAVYGNPKKQGDAAPVTGSYDAVYGNPTKQGDASPVTGSYDAVYGNPKKQGAATPVTGPYDAVYGNPKKQGDATPITGSYDAVYGNPQKIVGSSINAHKDASPIAGYDAVYRNPQKAGGSSINAQKDASSIAGYDAVYGSAQKVGESSINAHKDANSIAGYYAAYGNPRDAGESSIDAGKASPTASYRTVYGNPRKASGSTDINAGKPSRTMQYERVYGNPQKAGGSSVSAGKNSPNMQQGHQDGTSTGNVFLEKDLHPGTKMMVRFTKTSSAAHFLPQQVAESIPFSSNKLPEILNQFSVKENSAEAKIIQKTIEECEKPAIEGEEKYCARSLESLIDFSTSKLGKNIRALPNVVEGEIQEYKFGEGAKMLGEKSVVCHQLNYPYAVALCHAFHMTKIYKVPLVGADGTRVQALAVCHEDTSIWDPNALAFQVLKVKPGTWPICHFLPNGHFVWVPN